MDDTLISQAPDTLEEAHMAVETATQLRLKAARQLAREALVRLSTLRCRSHEPRARMATRSLVPSSEALPVEVQGRTGTVVLCRGCGCASGACCCADRTSSPETARTIVGIRRSAA